jgi:hypothetical protein
MSTGEDTGGGSAAPPQLSRATAARSFFNVYRLTIGLLLLLIV